MKTNNHRKAYAVIAVFLVIIAVSSALIIDPNLPSQIADLTRGAQTNDILAISKATLEERGIQGNDGKLTGGIFRILATTGSADAYFLQLNQSSLDNAGALPTNVQIEGSISFSAYQTYSPYWYLPVEKISDVTVYPKMTGSYKTGQATGYTIDPMTVTLWKTNPAQMQLIIPFSMGVAKTQGSNMGTFTTNYPGATLVQQGSSNYYNFAVSAESISSGSLSPIITFTNPSDSKETVKITLQFTINSAYQFPTEPWVVITEKDGGNIGDNVFRYSDLQTIQNVLDYSLNYDWSYYHYMYGGGNVFTGIHGHTSLSGSALASSTTGLRLSTWIDGTTAPYFYQPTPPYGNLQFVIDEGNNYGSTNTNTNFDFPGWYVPSPANTEGRKIDGDYYNYRLPLAGTLHNDQASARPVALSIINYLEETLTYNSKTKPFTLQSVNSDYWGYGASGNCPQGFGVSIPKGARQWLFTLDISTDVVDTVVVVQNYVDVKIENFKLTSGPDGSVGKGQSAKISCNLVNKSPYAGTVSVGTSLPAGIAYSVTSAGGSGLIHLDAANTAGATQTFELTLTNTGNLAADSGPIDLTLSVTNTEPRVTDSKTFQLNFLQGLGVADTSIVVTTKDADDNKLIGGITVKVYYGQTMEESPSPVTTTEGSATINLGVYTGYAKIVVSDSGGRYRSDEKTIGPLNHGANYVTFEMLTGDPAPPGITLETILLIVLIIVVIASAAAVAVYVYKKTKKR